jgi:chromosome partitioning protein
LARLARCLIAVGPSRPRAAANRQKIRCRFEFAPCPGITKCGRDIREALATFEIPLLKADVPDRVAYAEVMTNGTTMIESQPKGQGANDFRVLLAEIQELVA